MLHQDVIVELLSMFSHRRQSHAGICESQLQRIVNDGLNCGDGICTSTASSDDAAEGQGAGRSDAEVAKALPWISGLNGARQAVLVGMAFQMGTEGLLKFKNTLAMVQAGDYEGAAKGMLQSLWARQTPARAKRMSDQMKTGEWT